MRRFIGAAAVLAVFAVQGTAWAIAIRSDRSDSAYVSLGAEPAYASVGRFDGSTGNSGFVASGTLIAPDWVLTAAHVVDHAKSLSFSIAGQTYAADQWVADPKWTGNLNAGYDIGLVHLDKPVAGITPAVRYTGSNETGQVNTAVGYGKTGTGVTGANKFDGQKRAAQNVVDKIENGRILESSFTPSGPLATLLGSGPGMNLEGLIAPGDSGGGVFIDTATGTFLAGVNSFVASYDGRTDSSYGDISGHTRVSAFNSWIDSVLQEHPALSMAPDLGLDAAAIAATAAAATMPAVVPEPGTLGLLAAGGLGLLLMRRLRRGARGPRACRS